MAGIKIVAGLGNPGERYADTRHNAGVWFVDAIADSFGANFSAKKNIGATIAKTGGIANATTLPAVILLKPESYMNESGTAVAAAARYFEAAANEVLIAQTGVLTPLTKPAISTNSAAAYIVRAAFANAAAGINQFGDSGIRLYGAKSFPPPPRPPSAH